MPSHQQTDNILTIKKSEQYRTVEELIKRSRPTSVYYTFLVLSSFIVAAGLLLSNTTIVIGGMLITPVLGPVLVVALLFAVSELRLIKEFIVLMLKSFLIIISSALLLAFLFQPPSEVTPFENTIRAAALYFLIAMSAGVAATFAWARKEVAEVLPGIAIAVSLVPPLSLVGINISSFNLVMIRFSFLVFFFNLVGIVLGSIIAFVLMKFHRSQKEITKETKEIQKFS